jgi:hypothetical protein
MIINEDKNTRELKRNDELKKIVGGKSLEYIGKFRSETTDPILTNGGHLYLNS